jgi:hypothetical protein
MLDIIRDIEVWFEPINDYIMDNHDNPAFWVSIVIIGLALYGIAYAYFYRE